MFRGNEFILDKPSGVFRIAFLGDSFTFGEGVKFEDTYPEKVSQLLNQKYDAGSGKVFESYNFGVSACNTFQELFLLKHIVMSTRPDMVVIGYTLNDAEPTRYRAIPAVGLSPWWEATRVSLRELIQVCEEARIPCFIICFPLLQQLNSTYPFQDIHVRIRQEVRPEVRQFTHFIDLFDYFKGRNAADLQVHPTDQHPNEIGHAIAGQALFEGISKTPGLMPQRSVYAKDPIQMYNSVP